MPLMPLRHYYFSCCHYFIVFDELMYHAIAAAYSRCHFAELPPYYAAISAADAQPFRPFHACGGAPCCFGAMPRYAGAAMMRARRAALPLSPFFY
jgi:hypothetical protein